MKVIRPSSNAIRTVRPFRFADSDSVMCSDAGNADATSTVRGAISDELKDEDERLALSRRVADLEAALSEAAIETERRIDLAREDGCKEGRAQAESREQERLAKLGDAIEKARADAIKAIEAQHGLAVEIARATLGRILGDGSAFAAMVRETAAYWKAQLTGTAIVCVRVSEQDFPDEGELSQLRSKLGHVQIVADHELDRGSCVFALQLGEVDASIPLQAKRADALLTEYAAERSAG